MWNVKSLAWLGPPRRRRVGSCSGELDMPFSRGLDEYQHAFPLELHGFNVKRPGRFAQPRGLT